MRSEMNRPKAHLAFDAAAADDDKNIFKYISQITIELLRHYCLQINLLSYIILAINFFLC
jgi:hypothetical protein